MKITRRSFSKLLIASLGLSVISKYEFLQKIFPEAVAKKKEMPKRLLGKTGYNVGIFSLGGQATLEQAGTEKESIEIINRALDLGVNYIDTAAAYGRGLSEQYIGKVMRYRRKEVFLATKTHDRTYDGSMRLLEKSLNQLQTDRIDLWQLHNVRTEEDLRKIFANNGAIKALEEAKRNGVVRFLGITGHFDPFVLRKGIEEYDFDCVLVALNAADRHEKSFIDNFLPYALKKNLGIIGMKIPSRGRIFKNGGITSMKPALEYVLTLPVSTVIIGISNLRELEENVSIAKNFRPLSDAEMIEVENLTKSYYKDVNWFKDRW